MLDRDFDWNDLRFFLELARQGRLAQAAQRLKVDHTTVSRRIRTLEAALDTKLFVRSQDGFIMTDAAQRLLAQAEMVEASASSISETMGGGGSELSGHVRVASMEAFGSLYLSQKLIAFRQTHPGITVELVTAAYWVNLTKREADLLISFAKPNGHRLNSQKLGEFELKLYASPDYLAKHGTPQSIADLDEHEFVTYIDEMVMVEEVRWLDEIIKNPRISYRSTSMIAQYNACLGGLGISILPSFVAGNDQRLIPVLPAQASVKREFWLTSHADLEHVARIRAMGRFITKLITEDQAFLLGQK